MLLSFVVTVVAGTIVMVAVVVGVELAFTESFTDSSKQLSKVDFIISAKNLITEKTHALRSQITFKKSPSWSGSRAPEFIHYPSLDISIPPVFLSHSFYEMNVFVGRHSRHKKKVKFQWYHDFFF